MIKIVIILILTLNFCYGQNYNFPRATINGCVNGQIEQRIFLKQDSLFLTGYNSKLWKIKRFDFWCKIKGFLELRHFEKNYISDEIRNLIRFIPAGNKIFFDNIYISNDTIEKLIPSFSLEFMNTDYLDIDNNYLACLHDKFNGELKLDSLINDTSNDLIQILPDNTGYEIIGFGLNMINRGYSCEGTLYSSTNKLTPIMKECLKQNGFGKTIVFYDIYAKNEYDKIIKLNSIFIKIIK